MNRKSTTTAAGCAFSRYLTKIWYDCNDKLLSAKQTGTAEKISDAVILGLSDLSFTCGDTASSVGGWGNAIEPKNEVTVISNFEFLRADPGFASFMDVAMAAEKIIHIDPAASILNCRRAMEFAVKWIYSVDKQLEMPWQDNLQSLMNREEFRQIAGPDIWKRMDLIRKKGQHSCP